MPDFSQRLIAELPFILNVPEGPYDVWTPAGNQVVHVRHRQYAASDAYFDRAGSLAIGPKEDLLAQFPEENRSLIGLRSVIEQHFQVVVAEANLSGANEQALVDAIARTLVVEKASHNVGPALLAEAAVRLNEMAPAKRGALARATQLELTAKDIFPATLADDFVRTLNSFVRHYMVVVGDPFVEEVTLQQLAGTVVGGILVLTHCDGHVISSITTVGKIPPIMRRPWFDHGAVKIQTLRQQIAAGAAVDAIQLLAIRARMMLERGAYRSAIIEASSAMEFAIERRIVDAIVAGGQTEAAASAYLKQNQRFSDRCKAIFKARVGFAIPERDNLLWGRVVNHRDNLRHKIIHSNEEPSADDAKKAVEDFTALAELAAKGN